MLFSEILAVPSNETPAIVRAVAKAVAVAALPVISELIEEGKRASDTVPLAKLLALREVRLTPLIVGKVAGNLESGTVPLLKLLAFKLDPSM